MKKSLDEKKVEAKPEKGEGIISGAQMSEGAETSEEGPISEKVEDWKAKYEETIRELEETSSRSLYLRAEFDNFRKRMDREKIEWLKYGNIELVRSLLPIVDHLEQAVSHGKVTDANDKVKAVMEGIELILHQVKEVMKRYGISHIESIGKPFDPRFHEAVAREYREGVAPNRVTSEYRKGYVMHEKLLRPAQVIVSETRE
ncbi:MAG: nucleotide exchange factor GrpE, partial [Deltaproteobacteria bacterium]|nr:nucleotide exchange factor GrpE [Deltaproteobacteria bacterium]